MGKLHQTMRGMVCSKEVDGIGESTEYRGDPRLLVIDWSKNSRPMNREHVDEFKQVIRSGAYIPRIIIKVIDSKIHVIDGFHRSTAYLECIAEGVEIESVRQRAVCVCQSAAHQDQGVILAPQRILSLV